MLHLVSIDDEPDDVELIRLALDRAGVKFCLTHVYDEAGLRSKLPSRPDLVLCDYSMPTFSAERALAVVAEDEPRVPLVVVTRAIGEDAVVQLFRAGAKDYVAKDKLALLPAVIDRVLRERAMELERQRTAQQLKHANARLRLLSSRLVDAQERERTLIARELHDSLGQLLTGVVLHLHAAARGDNREQMERCRTRALELAQQAIKQVKSMSFQLRPPQLELLGFVPALQALIDRQLEAGVVRGTLRLRGNDPKQPQPKQAVALSVVREALTNVLRHASAHTVVVRLRFGREGRLVITLGDDGCGFDVKAALEGGLSEHNLGLHGMLERVELMGGRLRIRSTPGRGTALRLSM